MSDSIECLVCGSQNFPLDARPSGDRGLCCKDCKATDYKSKNDTAEDWNQIVSKTISQKQQSPPNYAGVVSAMLCYDSVDSIPFLNLGMLKKAVDEAIEKGMPLESDVFDADTEKGIHCVRFLYEADGFEKIECGEHITPSGGTDVLITTHECDREDD